MTATAKGVLPAIDAVLAGGAIEAVAAAGGRMVRTASGQVIFHQGDPADAVYLLAAGEVRTSVSPPSRDEEERTTLLLRAPALFGDRDLLAGCASLETACSVTEAVFSTFGESTFLETWKNNARLRDVVGRDLVLRYASSLIRTETERAPLWMRVAHILEERMERGIAEAPAPRYLALLTASPHKSVVRALATLREQGALRIDEGRAAIERTKLRELGVPEVARLFHSLSVK